MQVDDGETQTQSGIVIPDVWEGGKNLEGAKNSGIVLDIGEGEDSALKARTKDHLNIGERIIWKRHHQSYTFKEDNKTYSIIKFEHVDAVLH